MNEKESRFPFLLDAGLTYSESYEKQSDAACVFKYRFARGANYIEFRTAAGDPSVNVVVCRNGEFRFPNLALRHPVAARAFRLKHLFRPPTEEECWHFTARLVEEELKADPSLFGVLS